MGLVEKHPTDKGKYQATFSEYGHGKGNGKSRSMVYKHAKALKAEGDTTPLPKSPHYHVVDEDYTKSSSTPEIEIDDDTKSSSFEDVSWLNEEEDLPPPTIPSPIRKLGSGPDGELSVLHRATQAQLVRWGYMATDRGLTHWGRGVMQDDEWEIKRHPTDYDALEASTMHLMDANGISINLSPTMVWGTVVAAAYVPPIRHISKNAKTSLGGKFFGRIGDIVMAPYRLLTRRRKAKPVELVEDESEN